MCVRHSTPPPLQSTMSRARTVKKKRKSSLNNLSLIKNDMETLQTVARVSTVHEGDEEGDHDQDRNPDQDTDKAALALGGDIRRSSLVPAIVSIAETESGKDENKEETDGGGI